jgi:hypothetical protein
MWRSANALTFGQRNMNKVDKRERKKLDKKENGFINTAE